MSLPFSACRLLIGERHITWTGEKVTSRDEQGRCRHQNLKRRNRRRAVGRGCKNSARGRDAGNLKSGPRELEGRGRGIEAKVEKNRRSGGVGLDTAGEAWPGAGFGGLVNPDWAIMLGGVIFLNRRSIKRASSTIISRDGLPEFPSMLSSISVKAATMISLTVWPERRSSIMYRSRSAQMEEFSISCSNGSSVHSSLRWKYWSRTSKTALRSSVETFSLASATVNFTRQKTYQQHA